MEKLSDKYLQETLFQAKKFGLEPNFIQQLEEENIRRIEARKLEK